jgi:curved DNA-binding protein CbpA
MSASRPARHRRAAALLGVPHNADAAEIRRAFRTRVWEVHPDGTGGGSQTQRFTDLCAARDLLLEATKPAAARGLRAGGVADFLAAFGQSA